MAENKIVFSFDVRDQEKILQVLKELQKDTTVLGEQGAKSLSNVSNELEQLFKTTKNLQDFQKTLQSLGVQLSQTEQQLLKTFTSGQATSAIDTLKKQVETLTQQFQTIKEKMVEAGRAATDPTITPAQKQLAAAQVSTSAAQANALSETITKLNNIADSLKKIAESKEAPEAAAPSGEVQRERQGFVQALKEVFVTQGATPSALMTLGRYLPMAGALYGAYRTGAFLYGQFGPEAMQQAQAQMAGVETIAAREALQGDLTRQIFRSQGIGTAQRAIANQPIGLLETLGFGVRRGLGTIWATLAGEDPERYVRDRLLAAYEQGDIARFQYLRDAANQGMQIAQARDLQIKMVGLEPVLGEVQTGMLRGLSEQTTRPFAFASAMFQGRTLTANEMIYARMAQNLVGIDPRLSEQAIRFGLGAFGGQFFAKAFSTVSQLGQTDYLARNTLTGMVASISAGYGADASQIPLDLAAQAATLQAQAQADVARQRGIEPTALTPVVKSEVAEGISRGFNILERMYGSGTFSNIAMFSKLISMGLDPLTARAMIERGMDKPEVRRQTAVIMSNLRLAGGKNETEIDKELSELHQGLSGYSLKLVEGIVPKETEEVTKKVLGASTSELLITGQEKKPTVAAAMSSVLRAGGGTVDRTAVEQARLPQEVTPEFKSPSLMVQQEQTAAQTNAVLLNMIKDLPEMLSRAIKDAGQELLRSYVEQQDRAKQEKLNTQKIEETRRLRLPIMGDVGDINVLDYANTIKQQQNAKTSGSITKGQ